MNGGAFTAVIPSHKALFTLALGDHVQAIRGRCQLGAIIGYPSPKLRPEPLRYRTIQFFPLVRMGDAGE